MRDEGRRADFALEDLLVGKPHLAALVNGDVVMRVGIRPATKGRDSHAPPFAAVVLPPIRDVQRDDDRAHDDEREEVGGGGHLRRRLFTSTVFDAP